MKKLIALYELLVKAANLGQPVFLLAIRLYIGYSCALSGYRHFANFQNTVDTFRNDWHVPMPAVNAAVSATAELVGGLLLLIGFGSRLVGIVLTINFVVAILVSNLASPQYHDLLLHFWRNPDVIINDTAFPFLMTAIIVLLFGPGIFSIDGIIKFSREGRMRNKPR